MKQHDLIVIGAGPAGYVAAIRAAQLGLDAACIEREPQLGGTCLRIGCIPSKALLEASQRYAEARTRLSALGVRVAGVQLDLAAMMGHKQRTVEQLTQGVAGLLKKNKVTRYEGSARFAARDRIVVEGRAGRTELHARHFVIATGSLSAPLPGVELDGDRIGTSTEALAYPSVPKHLIVIGAGYIGLELGSVWARLGSKVTVLEYLDRILPGMDAELARDALKQFKRQGLEFHLSARVTAARVQADRCVVEVEGAGGLVAERVLVAVGRTPNTAGLDLDKAGVALDDRGRIAVDDAFRTNVEGVYAIGDVIRGPMLAHKAEDEGIACVERIVTGYGHVHYDAIPGVVYTHPEVASVGRTEEQLREAGVTYRKGVFHFRGNARARALADVEGFVKVLADQATDRVLGVHILGPHAGDLIAEAAVAIEFGASAEDLARSSHAHPTLAEAVKEAALASLGRAIHA